MIETTHSVSLTLEQIKALRMAIRWGIPSPCPPEIMDAQRVLGEAQVEAEAAVLADQWMRGAEAHPEEDE